MRDIYQNKAIRKKLSNILSLFCLLGIYASSMQVYGQYPRKDGAIFDQQIKHMDSLEKNLSRAQFMDSAIAYVYGNLYQNKFLPYTDMESLLSKYYYYAFNKFPKGFYRIYYYLMLMENGRVQDRYGEVLFFAEKADKEILDYGDAFAYTASNYKALIYIETGQFHRLATEYQNSPFNASHVFASKRKLASTVYDQLSNFMKFAMKACCQIRDTLHSNEIFAQAKKLLPSSNNVLFNEKIDSVTSFNLKTTILELDFYYYSILYKDKKATKKIVEDYSNLVNSANTATMPIENGYHEMADIMKLQYYTLVKDNDSIRYYIDKCKNTSDQYGYALYKNDYLQPEVEMYLASRNYKEAVAVENELKTYYFEKYGHIALSQLDLLYTNIQSDYIRRDLKKMESEKRLRTFLWVSVFVVILSVSAFVLLKMKKARVRLSRSLKNIQKVYQMQISKLDAEKQLAVLDEQQRLGQDLHDGLSGTMAGIQHQLNSLRVLETNRSLVVDIDRIRDNVEVVYTSLRRKSHQLFEQKVAFFDQEYETKINTIIETALPDENYNKEILIEKPAIASINMAYRENLLYILMECLTNIVKHAKATEVTILLSRIPNHTILQVSDNGNGGSGTLGSESSIGFKSLQKRAMEIGGTLTILHDEGTTVLVQI